MHINNGSNFKIIVSEVHKGIKSQIQSNLYLLCVVNRYEP